jgi:zinc transport system substrate-binding protein
LIEQYEEDVKATIARAQTRTLIHGGHNAFGYFAAHFGLTYVTPYSGFSTEIEPSPQARAELLRTMEQVGATVIFAEELINPRVATVIAQETGAEIIYLFTGENISRELYNEGVTLIDMLYLNLQRLKKGLNVID